MADEGLDDCTHHEGEDGYALVDKAQHESLRAEVERLRQRLLTAAGDDLCRLTQEEIKAMSAGRVPIPPKEEFLASCERFHAQVAGEAGVNQNCLTLAQLIAENERLEKRVRILQHERDQCVKNHSKAEVDRLRLLIRTIVSMSRDAFDEEQRAEFFKLAGINI